MTRYDPRAPITDTLQEFFSRTEGMTREQRYYYAQGCTEMLDFALKMIQSGRLIQLYDAIDAIRLKNVEESVIQDLANLTTPKTDVGKKEKLLDGWGE